MENKNIIKSFITECIDAILKIIINESTTIKIEADSSKLASPSIKNIATFLGYLTLAQDKPLLNEEINLKQLLIEAYQKKWVEIAILVVWKILRTSEKSKIFNRNNPWIIGMYSIIEEYLKYYLKTNPQADKNLIKEIQIVLKVRPQVVYNESTLFRDYEWGNFKNCELVYLTRMIVNNPLIVASKSLAEVDEIKIK